MSFTYIAADVLEITICTLKLRPFIVMKYTLEIFAAIGAFAESRFEILTALIKPLAEYVRKYLRDCHVWGLTFEFSGRQKRSFWRSAGMNCYTKPV
ncbi:MAG TPA: hypothetical protein VFP33_06510 [Gallionella sp.]|nr:hypothetical protein [Gallionella sp.]